MAITVSGTTITFNDATTQTTAAGGVPSFLAIGSTMLLYNFSGTTYAPNSNVAAANTGYASGTTVNVFTLGQAVARSGNVTVPGASGSTSYPNTTAVTGTWRTMSSAYQRVYDACTGTTTAFPFIAVRTA